MNKQIAILDTVSQYLTLKRVGSSHQACCPFHEEKTPSFHVFPRTNTFKCFGCGKYGDAYTFEMEYNHLSYPEAKAKLERGDYTHHHHFIKKKATKRTKALEREAAKKQYVLIQESTQYDLQWVKGMSPYLTNKHLVEVESEYRLGTDNHNNSFTAFPLSDLTNQRRGFQKISADGTKRYTWGTKKKGAFYIVRPITETTLFLIFCEGIASGLSTAQARPEAAVICTLDADNLIIVAKAFREQYPHYPIYFASDNDPNGVGVLKADKAARAVNGKLWIPTFPGEDYNDVLVKYGLAELKEQLSDKYLIKPIGHYAHSYPRFSLPELLNQYAQQSHSMLSTTTLQQLSKRAWGTIQRLKHDLKKEVFIEANQLEGVTITHLQEKYIPNHFQVVEGGINLLGSGLGSGKSHFMAKDAKPRQGNCLYIAPLTQLVSQMAQLLDFTIYTTALAEPTSVKNQKIATTLHSLPYFNFKELEVLYLDEIEQLLRLFTSPILPNAEAVQKYFYQLIKQAKTLIIADAFISQSTLQLLKQLRPHDPVQLLVPNRIWRQDGKGRTIHLHNQSQSLLQQITTTLEKGGRVLIPTNSRKMTEKVDLSIKTKGLENPHLSTEELIHYLKHQFPEKKGLVLNSKTIKQYQQVLANLNQLIDEYDYVIYSPSLGSGFSIDESVKPFDLVAVFLYGSVGTILDAWQLISRYRHRCDYHIWIQNGIHHLPTDEYTAWTNYFKARQQSEQILDKLLYHTYHGIPYEKTDFDHLVCQVEVQKNRLSNHFASQFLLVGELRGFHLEYEEDSTTKPPSGPNLNQIYDALITDQLLQAPSLTAAEVTRLTGNSSLESLDHDQVKPLTSPFQRTLTEAEQYQVHRYVLESFYDTQLSAELIKYDQGGRRRRQIRLLELANREDSFLAQQDFVDLQQQSATRHKHLLFKKQLIQQLLHTSGCRFEADGSLSYDGRAFTIHSLQVQQFLTWVESQSEAINGLKILPLRQDFKTSLTWFSALLSQIGLSLTHKKVQGNRYYMLHPDNFKRLNEHLVKRFTRFLEHQSGYHENKPGAVPPVNIYKLGAAAPSFLEIAWNSLINKTKELTTETALTAFLEILERHYLTRVDELLYEKISYWLSRGNDLALMLTTYLQQRRTLTFGY